MLFDSTAVDYFGRKAIRKGKAFFDFADIHLGDLSQLVVDCERRFAERGIVVTTGATRQGDGYRIKFALCDF